MPWPDAGVRPEIHVACSVAVHAHSAVVATLTDPTPVPASSALGGVRTTSHFTGEGPVATVVDELHPAAAAMTGAARNNALRPEQLDFINVDVPGKQLSQRNIGTKAAERLRAGT